MIKLFFSFTHLTKGLQPTWHKQLAVFTHQSQRLSEVLVWQWSGCSPSFSPVHIIKKSNYLYDVSWPIVIKFHEKRGQVAGKTV